MDDEHQLTGDFSTQSNIQDGVGSASYAGAFFPSSQSMVVEGGVFTSNVTNFHQTAPSLHSDLRMICLGDIDLRNEIRPAHKSYIVSRSGGQSERGCVRRVYSAKIGRKSAMTVALYEGENAEEEWREAISIFTRIRHPNLVQIFGATGACGARAIVFHDDLMPLEDFVDRHRHSHFAVVYIYDYCIAEFEDADDHVMRIFEIPLLDAASAFFIRRSTARFCVDLRPHSAWDSVPCVTSFTPSYMDSTSRRINMISPDAPDLETMFISSSTLDRYHQICSFNLRHRRDFLCAPRTVVSLGEIRYASPTSPLEDPAPVAFIPGPQVQVMTVFWSTSGSFMTIGDMDDEPMRHAWTRYMYKSRRFSSDLDVQWCAMAGATFHREFWLAQANYCFRHLQIASNYDDYVFVDRLTFRLVVSAAPKDPPQGYLFLWIGADLPEGTSTFSIPDYPAYWSLDATGAERLTTEEASELGFPGIKFTIQASGSSWDADVYVGLRIFHGAKGFDPYSQDVARHLDYPLYQLSGELQVPLAHSGDESTGSKDDETHPTVDIPVAELATIGDEQPERPSRCWQVLMVAKAMLILFLLICSLDKFLRKGQWKPGGR